MNKKFNARDVYNLFAKRAADIYPETYNESHCKTLAEKMNEVLALAHEKEATIIAHNYQRPEIQEVACMVGDSLGLSQYVASIGAKNVWFCSVLFMAQTAKIIVGGRAKIYVPSIAGCSLVDSIDQNILNHWKDKNNNGIVISYINSDPLTKAKSDFICTSRNASRVLDKAARDNPGKRILFLPDRYLGAVAIHEAGRINKNFDSSLVDLYPGQCHVHAKIGEKGLEEALDKYPDAELLVHPECGCASSCLLKTVSGNYKFQNAYYLSTEGMLQHAKKSPKKEFVVATESGMIYRLRKEAPEKIFFPVSYNAVCEYMKQITIDNLLSSLVNSQFEVLVEKDMAANAKQAIDRMLSVT